MARWGNALGGWRKQRRSKDGKFSSGAIKKSAIKKARLKNKTANKKSYDKHLRTPDKYGDSYNRDTKKAIAIGIVTPYGIGGAIMHSRNQKKYESQLTAHRTNVSKNKKAMQSSIQKAKADHRRRSNGIAV